MEENDEEGFKIRNSKREYNINYILFLLIRSYLQNDVLLFGTMVVTFCWPIPVVFSDLQPALPSLPHLFAMRAEKVRQALPTDGFKSKML